MQTESGMLWGRQLLQDIRYGLRSLRFNPGFSALVILILALGIGMNTAVFSIVNAVLLNPLPYPYGERIVWMVTHSSSSLGDMVAVADFQDLQERSRSFEEMALYGYQNQAIQRAGDTLRIRVASVSGDFWNILGARAAAGRLFDPDERNSIVLSNGLFMRFFGGDPSIVGKTIEVDGQQFTVTGVLPQKFRFLLPIRVPFMGEDDGSKDPEAYVSMTLPPAVRGTLSPYNIVSRLRPGMTVEQARAEAESVQASHAAENTNPMMNEMKPRVEQLSAVLTSQARKPLLVLTVAVIFVLLVAAANIANLLMVQATKRRREIAIRTSLGAGRMRLIRQFLVESCLLSLLGGLIGLMVAKVGIAVVLRLIPEVIPRLAETAINVKVLLFAAAVSLGTGILFGVGPSFAFSRSNLSDTLKEGTWASAGTGMQRLRNVLIAVEMALAIVLLMGAGLMVKSFWRMNARVPGFNPESIVVMKLDLSGPEYRDRQKRNNLLSEILRRAEAAPGARAGGVSAISTVIFGAPDDKPPSNTTVNAVSPAYGEAVGMRLISGRWITDADSARTTVINQSAARLWFGRDNPIGRTISISSDVSFGPIVGVVQDLKYLKLDEPPGQEIYIPYKQAPFISSATLALHVGGDSSAVIPVLRKIASEIDHSEATAKIQTLEAALSDSIAPKRFSLFLLGTFASAAWLLAAIGIYGVISYSITQRTHEIGVRMALGAQRGGVVAMIVGQGMKITLIGITAGVILSYMLTSVMASLLYDVKPHDLPTLVVVVLSLAGTALLASWIPAVKGARVNPVIALRYE